MCKLGLQSLTQFTMYDDILMDDYISVSQIHKSRNREYYRMLSWLRNHAQHDVVRKGRQTFWHPDDIAAAKPHKRVNRWREDFRVLFAEPKTLYDALDVLAKQGVFPSLDGFRSLVNRYERRGVLQRVGVEKNSGNPKIIYQTTERIIS